MLGGRCSSVGNYLKIGAPGFRSALLSQSRIRGLAVAQIGLMPSEPLVQLVVEYRAHKNGDELKSEGKDGRLSCAVDSVQRGVTGKDKAREGQRRGRHSD